MSKQLNPNQFEEALQLSNQLVSKSHISFESALYFHGLIDKIPNEILGVGDTKKYIKPLGNFRYLKLRNCSYPKGVKKISVAYGGKILIASKEKAIADILVRHSTPQFRNEKDVEAFLIDEIGVKKDDLNKLDDDELINIRIEYNKLNVRLLSRLYSKIDGGRIWIANFPRTTTEEELRNLFQPFGEVLSIKIRLKPLSYTMAFISMKNPLEGKQAIRNLDRQLFKGLNITRVLPKPKTQAHNCKNPREG